MCKDITFLCITHSWFSFRSRLIPGPLDGPTVRARKGEKARAPKSGYTMFQDHAIYARTVPSCAEYAQRRVVMHQVSASELNDLVSGNTSLSWIFCGISFGSF